MASGSALECKVGDGPVESTHTTDACDENSHIHDVTEHWSLSVHSNSLVAASGGGGVSVRCFLLAFSSLDRLLKALVCADRHPTQGGRRYPQLNAHADTE